MGASERVMEYLDRPPAAQLGTGRTLPSFSGRARPYPFFFFLLATPRPVTSDLIRGVL